MTPAIELQFISKILTGQDESEINTLCSFDLSYYNVFRDQISFILDHRTKYQTVPDVFTFKAEFPDVVLVDVREPLEYLVGQMKLYKQQLLLIETFNKVKDLGNADAAQAWEYVETQYQKAMQLVDCKPLDLVKDAHERARVVQELSKQTRIPTGFPEIDKVMYGGLSTVEELLLLVARTNSGKSWCCTKMMETAQANGFNVLYYSPEMQGAYLGTRFDTWRTHMQNSQLFLGKYTDEYFKYLDKLSEEEASAIVLEDKDTSGNEVNVRVLENLVKKYNIQELIIDGLSYMSDIQRSDTDYIKYKNICAALFKLSKQHRCAVIVVMQANRETKDCKDDKGEPMPNLYNIEGSDHPARICTQAFSIRQIFDKHVLDIRLEKSRNANNQRPVFSYSWDINTGNMQYLPSGDAGTNIGPVTPTIVPPTLTTTHVHNIDDALSDDSLEGDDDIEF